MQAVDFYLHQGHQQHTHGLLNKAIDSYRRARQMAQNIKDKGAEGRFFFFGILRSSSAVHIYSPAAEHIYIECAFIDCHRLRTCAERAITLAVSTWPGARSALPFVSRKSPVAFVETNPMHVICVNALSGLNADMSRHPCMRVFTV